MLIRNNYSDSDLKVVQLSVLRRYQVSLKIGVSGNHLVFFYNLRKSGKEHITYLTPKFAYAYFCQTLQLTYLTDCRSDSNNLQFIVSLLSCLYA